MDDDDRIERTIEIAAPADTVWKLVSEPGWWINDGQVVEHRIERDGDTSTVHDPVHGAFTIRTERLDPPRHAAFRWLTVRPDGRIDGGPSTLVEFWIEDRTPSGVVLRVVESGFGALEVSEQQRRLTIEDNTAGWETELAAARTHLESR